MYDIIAEKLHFSKRFPNTRPKLVWSAADGEEKKQPGRVVWCLCWMGEFSVQAEQTFRPPVQSDCFIVTSCWVWSIYTHLWLLSDSAMDMIFTSVSGKIISWLLPAASFFPVYFELCSLRQCRCCLDCLFEFVCCCCLFATASKWSLMAQFSDWGALLSQSAIWTLTYHELCVCVNKQTEKLNCQLKHKSGTNNLLQSPAVSCAKNWHTQLLKKNKKKKTD